MQQTYIRCSPLRRYSFVVGIFLQSCDVEPIAYSDSQQILKQEVKKTSKNHVNNAMLLDIEPCSDQDESAPKKQEIKPKRIAIRKKRLAAQSNKNTHKQPQLTPSNVTKRRPLKRKIQHRVGTTSTTTTQDFKPKVLEEFHQDNLQADEDKQLIRPIIKRTEPQADITHREATKTEEQQLSLTTNSPNISCVDDAPKSTIEELPVEVLQNIFSYISFKKMLPVRSVNHFFYTLTTGYNQVGVIGIQNKPDSRKLVDSWRVGRLTNFINFISCEKFNQGIWNHQNIPSFIFYQFMDDLLNFSTVYWSCLPAMHIRSLMIKKRKISIVQAEELGRYLVGSKVRKLTLCMQLGDEGIEAFSRQLSKTNVEIIDLECNHIGPKGAEGLFKNLQGSKVKEVQLNMNKVKGEGLEHIGKYLSRTAVQSLGVACNDIEAEVIKEFLRSLGKDTGLKEIYLGGNGLTEEDRALVGRTYSHLKFT